ncbi:MAG: hypothetical protein M3224_03785 [Thermoproteota archaeon]|nr:hypothetical protein [Thermoproteota archaeon]MDQ3971621.1 hypothetical protein [Thermoproteota archaeon]MDQ4022828.1 hypothetical protein [Thermoproteota archaeon]
MTTITMRGAATARIKRKKGRRVSSLNTLQDNSIIESYRRNEEYTRSRTGQIQQTEYGQRLKHCNGSLQSLSIRRRQ